MNDINLKYAQLGIKCYQSFYFFFKTFWSEMSGEELIEAPHLKLICDTLQEKAMKVINNEPIMEVVMINVPPGSSKSTIATIAFPMWVWLHAPHLSSTNVSYSATLSARHAAKARLITESEKWKLLFNDIFTLKHGKPLKIVKQNQTEMVNNFKGDRFNTSVGGTITGMHADFIIKDDMQNPQEANSDTVREGTNSWNDETLTSRHKQQTCYLDIVIAQRLHESDLCGHLLQKNITITQLCLPGEITANAVVIPEKAKELYTDGILDPIRKPKEVLMNMKENMGSAAYTTQVIQQPFNLEEQAIKPAMFDIVTPRDDMQFDLFVDGAYTEKTENDPSGITVTGFKDNNLYIKDAYNVYKTLPDLVRFIVELGDNNVFDVVNGRIFIEPKASGYSLQQYLQKETKFNVVMIGQDKRKGERNIVQQGKTARHTLIQTKAEAHRIKLFKGGWNEDYITQICGFPRAAHDEQVDNTGYAIYNYYLNEDSFIPPFILERLKYNVLGELRYNLITNIEGKEVFSSVSQHDDGAFEIYNEIESSQTPAAKNLYKYQYLTCVSISNIDSLDANIMTFDRLNKTITSQMQLTNTSESEIIKYAVGISEYYHKAKLIFTVRKSGMNSSVEETDVTQYIIKQIRPMRLRTLYSRLQVNNISKQREKEYGFILNSNTKREIYINLKEKLTKNVVKETPLNVYSQLQTISRTKETGLIDVRDGLNDLAIANFAVLIKIDEEWKQKPVNRRINREL